LKLPKSKRFWIETWGCQMNELDTQRMAGQLMQSGMLPTRSVEDADIILLNSCSVREKAEHKVFSQLGRYRRFKADNPGLLIGLCGCVAQQVGESALDRNPDLDFVLGPARVGELSRILDRRQPGERIVATGFPEERLFDIDTISRAGTYKGMVTVIEGCDKNCTFCIVPMTRGSERCRPLEDILIEVEHLVEYGFLEIELLGQTVNHWREPGGQWDFADLLDRVARVPGVERLRFVTSYPRDFTPRMVEQFRRHPNICPYLHLPVQSGSDRMLKRMGRGYTIDSFRRLVEALRAARADLALSTDLIVGFPGETDGDFQETATLVEEVGFASVYAFKYSPRPGTAALNLPDAIPDDLASERLQKLLQLQERIQRGLNEQLVGAEMDVLVTGWAEPPQLQSGRTACHRIVHFPAEPDARPLGSIAPVVIEKANPHSLLGRQPTIR
jgi:tRNA-2-methylthio-N6-dimethylallyladenosine synthase